MSGFSNNAWKGFGFYYQILEKIHYTKLVSWDPKSKYLCENKRPKHLLYLLWGISLSFSILISLVIPSFLFFEFVFTGYNSSRNFTYEKLFAVAILFLAGVHSIPTSIKLFSTYKDMVAGFNLYIRLQRHLSGEIHDLFSRRRCLQLLLFTCCNQL